MTFQRARSEEQRELRRQTILEAAEVMLDEMPVAQVSLNELSRRAGLAKSNVLRYFDSREAILLELLDHQTASWMIELSEVVSAINADASVEDRVSTFTSAVASTLAARPSLCDLLYAESGVLERNVSVEAVMRHKRATQRMAQEFERLLVTALPELSDRDLTDVVISLLLVAAAAWPYAEPGETLAAAYTRDDSMRAMHRDFTSIVQRATALAILGLLSESAAR